MSVNRDDRVRKEHPAGMTTKQSLSCWQIKDEAVNSFLLCFSSFQSSLDQKYARHVQSELDKLRLVLFLCISFRVSSFAQTQHIVVSCFERERIKQTAVLTSYLLAVMPFTAHSSCP